MSEQASTYVTSRIEEADPREGFRCGKHPLDDYFRRHAIANETANVARTYVLRRGEGDDPGLPAVLGFYSLSMAEVPSAQIATVIPGRLPRYDLPVALIGRLAVDERAQRRRFGEKLLLDALRRVVDGGATFGCVGIVVDAKDESAEHFYGAYGFVTVDDSGWPRRIFVRLGPRERRGETRHLSAKAAIGV